MLHQSFARRFRELVDTLSVQPGVFLLEAELRPPLPDAEREALLAQLPFTLDERFVGYYRACDGVSLSWVKADNEGLSDDELRALYQAVCTEERDLGEEVSGHLHLPPLADLITGNNTRFEPFFAPGEVDLDALGGFDGHELFVALRNVDFDDVYAYDYHNTALVLHPRYPDPMLLFTADHMADVDGAHPIPARLHLELMLATAGSHTSRRIFRVFRGYSGDFPPLEPDLQPLLDHAYGQPGHTGAVRAVAAGIGIQLPDYASAYAEMDADRDRFAAAFDAFGVRHTFTGHTNAGGYVQFEIPGDMDNLLATEAALEELRRAHSLSGASAGYRERPDFGMSQSLGNLMLDLKHPGEVDTRDGYLVYRTDALPPALRRLLAAEHPAHGCLFYCYASGSASVFRELPEPPMDNFGPGMELARVVCRIAMASGRMLHLLGDCRGYGFHTAPAAEAEVHLSTKDIRRYGLADLFADLMLFELSAADGTPFGDRARITLSAPGRPDVVREVSAAPNTAVFATRRPHPVYTTVEIAFLGHTVVLEAGALPAPGEIAAFQAE